MQQIKKLSVLTAKDWEQFKWSPKGDQEKSNLVRAIE